MLLNQSIVDMRAHECAHAEIKNKKYKNLLKKNCVIQEQLIELVPEDKKNQFRHKLTDYEDVITYLGAIEQKESYKQGLNDGLEIALQLIKTNR